MGVEAGEAGPEEAKPAPGETGPENVPFSQLLKRWKEEEPPLPTGKPPLRLRKSLVPLQKQEHNPDEDRHSKLSDVSNVSSEKAANAVGNKEETARAAKPVKAYAANIENAQNVQQGGGVVPTQEQQHRSQKEEPNTSPTISTPQEVGGVPAAISIPTGSSRNKNDPESSGQDWDSTVALKQKRSSQVVLPRQAANSGGRQLQKTKGQSMALKQSTLNSQSKTSVSNCEDKGEKPANKFRPKNRQPNGHRFHEDYNSPPPNFTTADTSRRRLRQKEEYFSSRHERELPSIAPTIEGVSSQTSPEPGGKRLPELYLTKPLPPPVSSIQKTTLKTQRPQIEPRPAPRKKVVHERLMSAQDCDGATPKEEMYPSKLTSKRTPVDAPETQHGEMTTKEKLAFIKSQVAVAEQLAALRKMKHQSKEVQDLLSKFDGKKIKVPVSKSPKPSSGEAEKCKSKSLPRLDPASKQKSQQTIPHARRARNKRRPGSPSKRRERQQGIREKQFVHDNFTKLNTALASTLRDPTRPEELLGVLEANMLREQKAYDDLIAQIRKYENDKVAQVAAPSTQEAIADPKPEEIPPPTQQKAEETERELLERQRRREVRAYLIRQRLVQIYRHMDDSQPYDEVEETSIPLHAFYPFPPAPPAAVDRSRAKRFPPMGRDSNAASTQAEVFDTKENPKGAR